MKQSFRQQVFEALDEAQGHCKQIELGTFWFLLVKALVFALIDISDSIDIK